jgi:putative two-component system response regulator
MKVSTPEILAGAVEETLPSPADGDSAISETEAILIAVAQSVEQRDLYTARHCERLAFISVAMGMALHLDRASLMALYRGGFLHDVGKIGIPDAILFKPARLTAEEWIVMRSHTVRGEDICRPVKALHTVLPIIRSHHERWDGSGYPDGLRRTQIPLLARVLQIADIYDALTSPRPYKRAYTAKQALRIIVKETERGWRDPRIVSLFLQIHGEVISRIDDRSLATQGRFEAMRGALNQLEKTLTESSFNQYDFPDFSASARTSFPLPRSVPPPGSP